MGVQVTLPSKAVPDASASVGGGVGSPPIMERK